MCGEARHCRFVLQKSPGEPYKPEPACEAFNHRNTSSVHDAGKSARLHVFVGLLTSFARTITHHAIEYSTGETRLRAHVLSHIVNGKDVPTLRHRSDPALISFLSPTHRRGCRCVRDHWKIVLYCCRRDRTKREQVDRLRYHVVEIISLLRSSALTFVVCIETAWHASLWNQPLGLRHSTVCFRARQDLFNIDLLGSSMSS
jgi:hypothetical protein